MTKERIKNLLLMLLVIMNFVLGSRILIEKKLWPGGYNFFSNMGNLEFSRLYTNIKSYFTDEDTYKTKVFDPEKIVINTGDQTTRIAIYSADAEFDGLIEEAYVVLRSAFESDSENFSPVKAQELYSALSATSLYFEYPISFTPELFSKVLGTQGNAISEMNIQFCDVVIVNKPRTEVYIADRDADLYYRIYVPKGSERLTELVEGCIKKHSKEGDSAINYSFDLKFDKPFGTQKTTLNPLILIYSTMPEYPQIYAQNPIANGEAINEVIVGDILRVFNINASTMRRYTEAGGTVVFVENNAILKIDKNGYLEYQATDGGIDVSATGDEYTNTVNIASLGAGINEAVGSSCTLRISENENNEKNKYNFDYIVSGIPVKINNGKISSGIEAVVDNGVLISYKQLVRKYDITDSKTTVTEFFTALDSVIASYSEFMNEINIDKMYFGYSDDATAGNKTADWVVKVDNIVAQDNVGAD